MFGSVTLEVVIGVIFVFLLISIICSTIREGLEAILKTRAAYLEHGIRQLLQDAEGTGLAKAVYEHPLIYGLFSGGYQPATKGNKLPVLASGKDLPSYIPSKNFAIALMDIAARGASTDAVSSHPSSPVISLQSLRTNIMNLDSPVIQRVLLTAIDTAQGDLDRAQKNVETWFDSSMDRISGWYKRSTHWILFFIGLAVAIALNVNTVTIIDYLYKHDAERTAIVARAQEAAKDTALVSQRYDVAKRQLEQLYLPIGWSQGWGALKHKGEPGSEGWWNNVWAPILGWLIMALATTMGAPFWFDLLNKIMVIRSTVKPHEKSPEESSEDRQRPNQRPSVLSVQESTGTSQTKNITPVQEDFKDIPAPRDVTSQIDGCGIESDVFTKDEDLPPAEGGVA
jgi:hypothetical protein